MPSTLPIAASSLRVNSIYSQYATSSAADYFYPIPAHSPKASASAGSPVQDCITLSPKLEPQTKVLHRHKQYPLRPVSAIWSAASIRSRRIAKVMLKISITFKSESLHNADDGCRCDSELAAHVSYI